MADDSDFSIDNASQSIYRSDWLVYDGTKRGKQSIEEKLCVDKLDIIIRSTGFQQEHDNHSLQVC